MPAIKVAFLDVVVPDVQRCVRECLPAEWKIQFATSDDETEKISAWGHDGPWKDRRGYDTIVQSATGLAHASVAGGTPAFLPVSALDYLG